MRAADCQCLCIRGAEVVPALETPIQIGPKNEMARAEEMAAGLFAF